MITAARVRTPRVAGALCVGLGLLAGLEGAGCNLYPELTRSEEAVSPRPQDCAACHVDVAAEWRASGHARAWTAERFVTATHGRTMEGCLPCHAPGSLHETQGEPRLRDERREDGVDCQACHLDHGALVGPIEDGGGLVEPHPVRVMSALYRSPELCGRCHAGTLAEYRVHAGPGEKTCQGCHMPAIERKLTQATDTSSAVLVAFEDEVPQRRHAFDLTSGVAAGESVAAVASATRSADGVAVGVALENRLPHAIPTGDFAPRHAHLALVGRDAAGGETGRIERRLWKELGQALVPGVASVTTGTLPAATTRVEVTLTRVGAAGAPLELLRRVLEVGAASPGGGASAPGQGSR